MVGIKLSELQQQHKPLGRIYFGTVWPTVTQTILPPHLPYISRARDAQKSFSNI